MSGQVNGTEVKGKARDEWLTIPPEEKRPVGLEHLPFDRDFQYEFRYGYIVCDTRMIRDSYGEYFAWTDSVPDGDYEFAVKFVLPPGLQVIGGEVVKNLVARVGVGSVNHHDPIEMAYVVDGADYPCSIALVPGTWRLNAKCICKKYTRGSEESSNSEDSSDTEEGVPINP